MDHLSAPAGARTDRGTGVTYTSIGVEVEEPLFLDEAEGHGEAAGKPEPPSPFDLFADENELRPATENLLVVPAAVARPAAPARNASPAVPRPAQGKPAVEARELFTQPSSPRHRVSLVALFVLVAATTMFITVQACQLNRAPKAANTAQPGR